MQQEQRIYMDMSAQEYQSRKTREFGNHHIYSKKAPAQKWNDKRLRVLEPELFINRIILDIGCNQGVLSIPIALKYQPQLVKGIDVDKGLLDKFNSNIQKFTSKNKDILKQKLPVQLINKISQLPLYFQEEIQKIAGKNEQHIITIIPPIQIKTQEQNSPSFPENIVCQMMNVLAPQKVEFYDTILCMNVTKWIHLVFGDEGIKRLFGNISSMLHEGGVLILEAQPWKSYKKKKNLQKIYQKNYGEILNRPQRFKDILKSYGLALKETISPTSQNELKHPIQIFQKKGFYSDVYS